MALIYITGVAGTGKSTICNHLRQLGYTAYDADVDGFMGWRRIATGTPVRGFDDPDYLTESWLARHEWSLNRQRVESAAAEAKDEIVFICGTSANDEDVHDLLQQVVFLTIDESELRHRLATRQTNAFGKTEDELLYVLGWLKPAEEYYRNFGAIMLDAAAPLDHVVGQILSFIHPEREFAPA